MCKITHLAAPFNGKCCCGAAGRFLVDAFAFGAVVVKRVGSNNQKTPLSWFYRLNYRHLLEVYVFFDIYDFLGVPKAETSWAAAPVQSCTVWTSFLLRVADFQFGLEHLRSFVAKRSPNWFGGPFWFLQSMDGRLTLMAVAKKQVRKA